MPAVVHATTASPGLLHVHAVALHLPMTAAVFVPQSPLLPDVATLPMPVVPPGAPGNDADDSPMGIAMPRHCQYGGSTHCEYA